MTILCDVLGVSPAGYYAWRARPESRRSAANRNLVDDIKRVHRDTHGRYGSPRICSWTRSPRIMGRAGTSSAVRIGGSNLRWCRATHARAETVAENESRSHTEAPFHRVLGDG